MKTTGGIEGHRLRALRTKRGMTLKELADRLGWDRHTLAAHERGDRNIYDMEYGRLLSLANALGVTTSTIVRGSNLDWDAAAWNEQDKIQIYLEEVADSRNCLVATDGIDSYLVPDPLVKWSERTRLEKIGWEPTAIDKRLETWGDYVGKQLKARDNSRYAHRILAPLKFLGDGFAVDSNWLEAVKENLTAYENETALGLVPANCWQQVKEMVGRYIPWTTYDKILISDNLAMVRPTREWFLFTRSREIIDDLTKAIETVVPLVPYGFPDEHAVTPTAFRNCTDKAKAILEKLVRPTKNTDFLENTRDIGAAG